MFDIHVRQAAGCVQAPFYVQRTRERGRKKGREGQGGTGKKNSDLPIIPLDSVECGARGRGPPPSPSLSPPPQPCFSEGITRLHVEPKQGCSPLTELQGSGSLWPCRPVAWQLKQWDRVLGAGFRTVSAVGMQPFPTRQRGGLRHAKKRSPPPPLPLAKQGQCPGHLQTPQW